MASHPEMNAAEIEALGVAREVAANKRMKAPGFIGNAAAYETDANRRSKLAQDLTGRHFTSAVDQEIDANRRAREAGYLNAADYESGLRTRKDPLKFPFVDPRTPGGTKTTTTGATTTGATTTGATTTGANANIQQQTIAQPTVDAPNIQKIDMASLTSEMDLTNKLEEIINKNSPLFKAASTKAMQNMQRRGFANSTMAYDSVMNAILAVGVPLAQAEVNNLMTNLYYNKDWTNKQKMQANEAAYNKMLTQLQGKINFTLQQLSGSQSIGLQTLKGKQATGLQTLIGEQSMTISQQKIKADLWSKYGDWVTTMAAVEGADQEAWQNMLDLLSGAGGWPKPT